MKPRAARAGEERSEQFLHAAEAAHMHSALLAMGFSLAPWTRPTLLGDYVSARLVWRCRRTRQSATLNLRAAVRRG